MAARANKNKRRTLANLETWLLQAAESPTSPLTHADFNAIRDRVKNRNAATKCRSH